MPLWLAGRPRRAFSHLRRQARRSRCSQERVLRHLAVMQIMLPKERAPTQQQWRKHGDLATILHQGTAARDVGRLSLLVAAGSSRVMACMKSCGGGTPVVLRGPYAVCLLGLAVEAS